MKKVLVTILALCLCLSSVVFADEFEGQETDPLVGAMLPMFDSITRIFDSEDAQPLDNDNPSYLWGSLYLLSVNWCYGDTDATVTDFDIALPADKVLAFAQAMFYGLQSLPPIPDDMAASISYDEANDAYVFGLSDAGNTYVSIDDIFTTEDGSVMVTVGEYEYGEDDGVYLDSLTFVLEENPSGTVPYYYSIVSVGRG